MPIDANYKMTKPTKTMLNMMFNDERKADFKLAFSQAETLYEAQRKKKIIKVLDAGDDV